MTFDMAAYVDTFDGYWCTECERLCYPSDDEGLRCACDHYSQWLDEGQYPKKWIKVVVEVRKADE